MPKQSRIPGLTPTKFSSGLTPTKFSYTLIASASRHDLDLWAYLDDVLRRLAGGETNLDALLPDRWRETHPESVRTYRQQESEVRQARTKQRRARRRELAARR
jgi:transposase